MTEIKNLLIELEALREENQHLKVDNDFLQRQNAALKLRCSDYSKRLTVLESEIADMKFTRKYLTGEEAGRRFAEELLGNATPSDIAEEKAIADGENHYYRFYDGDDY